MPLRARHAKNNFVAPEPGKRDASGNADHIGGHVPLLLDDGGGENVRVHRPNQCRQANRSGKKGCAPAHRARWSAFGEAGFASESATKQRDLESLVRLGETRGDAALQKLGMQNHETALGFFG